MKPVVKLSKKNMKGGENFNEIIDRKRGETEYEYQLKLNGPLYKKNELIKINSNQNI